MWKNYFKVSFRNLRKRKLYTGINILGLTIAIVSFLAISLYIYHEWTYDRMYSGYENIYKVNQEFIAAGESQLISTTPSQLIPSMAASIPEVETGTLVFDISIFSSVLVDNGEGNQEENKFAYADENFFQVFDLPLIAGNPALVLSEPKQIVLTRSSAARYFGNPSEAAGKTLKVDGTEYQVTGVMEDFPSNSHLDFDFLASFKTLRHGKNPEWSPSNYYSYVKFRPETNLSEVDTKMDLLIEQNLGEAQKNYGYKAAFHFQPVTNIHLDKELKTIKPTTDIRYLFIFGVVAILLICIGIINYVNLATAEATERNKEVGLRKVMGADRSQLFGQFISESFILTTAGLVFSILILFLIGSGFESLTGVPLQLDLLFSPMGLAVIAGILVLVSILSGLYPAMILSGLEPLKALGKNIHFGGGAWLRKSLVIFQFFVSISLLIATFIIQRQLEYMQSVNLGYEREEVISLSYHYKMRETVGTIKKEMIRTGAAKNVALAADMPVFIKAGYKIFPGGDNDKEMMITGYSVDHDIVQTLGLKLMSGENFTETDISRSAAEEQKVEFPIMLNESAVKALGWTAEEAVGKKVDFGGRLVYIKAVVGDFYFNSLHHEVGPLAIMIDPDQTNVLLVKLAAGNPQQNLAALENTWKTLAPDRPFNYRFIDDEYARMYRSEERVGDIFTVFSGIAIFIACMGLFGLVSYVALRRTREISIRKVLGATSTDVLKVLSSDFFRLLGISALMAIVFGIWFSKEWMEGFAYKTQIPVWIYMLSIIIVGMISLMTIGYRTAKVYLQNPVKSLKDD